MSNQALAVVSPPASGLGNVDPWTISSVTNNIALVGTYTVSITISLISFPTVTPCIATFLLTVYDKCATALIDNLSQSLNLASYIVTIATGPTTVQFKPYSDSVAQQYVNPSICGPKAYTIVEGYSFVTIS